jgi:hypothetical protein
MGKTTRQLQLDEMSLELISPLILNRLATGFIGGRFLLPSNVGPV